MKAGALLACILLTTLLSEAQLPYQVERNVSVRLKKNENRQLVLMMDSSLSAKIKIESSGLLNFKVSDPAGQVLHEDQTFSSAVNWQFGAKTNGAYTIDLLNLSPYTGNRVTLKLKYTKFKGLPRIDDDYKLVKRAKHEIQVDGGYKINRKISKTYPIIVEEADTLALYLNPRGSQSSYLEVSNDQGEIVYAQFPKNGRSEAIIPIYAPGTYTSTLTRRKFVKYPESIRIEKWSPNRYEKKLIEDDNNFVQYDTIWDIFLDTNVFLGAKRDILHESEYNQELIFPSEDSTIFWGLIYGYGKSFNEEVMRLEDLLDQEALALGVTDLISAYDRGYIRRLPSSRNSKISVDPSPRVKEALEAQGMGNFALLDSSKGYFQISFENTSESSGQVVYLKVVQFKHVPRQ